MSDAAGESAAWAALLPDGTVWLPGHQRMAARRLRRALAELPPGPGLAIAASPWAFGRRRGKAAPAAVRTYIAVPSWQSPVLVASRDPAVLRYVAASVLSVPPGTGPLPSMALTAGLRLLRLPAAWILAAILRAGRVVLVGRPG
jgi:soluble lytic murein transglycosylase-like protein